MLTCLRKLLNDGIPMSHDNRNFQLAKFGIVEEQPSVDTTKANQSYPLAPGKFDRNNNIGDSPSGRFARPQLNTYTGRHSLTMVYLFTSSPTFKSVSVTQLVIGMSDWLLKSNISDPEFFLLEKRQKARTLRYF